MRKTTLLIVASSALASNAVMAKTLFQNNENVTAEKTTTLTKTAIPVNPGQKYQISFSAGTTGDHVLEENERIRIMNHRGAASSLRIQFLDAENGTLNYGDIYVLTRNPRKYVRVFYPPTNAASMTLAAIPAKNTTLTVEKLDVSTDLTGAEGECLNPHPTFENGDVDTYGCRPGYGGRFYQRPDGTTVFKTGFLGYTPSFPVKGNTYYTVCCRGVKHRGRGSWIVLECYDGKNRRPIKEMRVNVSEKGEITKLLVPDGTVKANLRCYYVILEELRISEKNSGK